MTHLKEIYYMKRKFFQNKLSVHLILLLTLPLFLNTVLDSQTPLFSDDQLVRIGQDVYRKGDYIGASLYLFAYIQKRPALISNNAAFEKEVQGAYQYSLDEVRRAWSERQSLSKSNRGDESDASITHGLHRPPPPLNIPQ